MEKIRAVVVDDILSFRENLIQDLKEYTDRIEVVGQAEGVVDAGKLIRQCAPDVVFLDVQIKQGTAFDLLELLGEINFKIIFTTASDEYAVKAFKLSAVDYLLKPIDIDELKKAVDKLNINSGEVLNNLRENVRENDISKKRLALHSQDKIEMVALGDIIRCESNINYTKFFLKDNRTILVTKTLKEYDAMLSDFDFIRVHQSHLVNIAYLKEFVKIDGGYLKLKDGSNVPISTRKKAQVLKLLQGVF